jgi:hypothetical protein
VRTQTVNSRAIQRISEASCKGYADGIEWIRFSR